MGSRIMLNLRRDSVRDPIVLTGNATTNVVIAGHFVRQLLHISGRSRILGEEKESVVSLHPKFLPKPDG
jgi:hypothetical protein